MFRPGHSGEAPEPVEASHTVDGQAAAPVNLPLAESNPQQNRPAPETSRPENRLAKEVSPYLQLHKHNPIDWYPWGSEALDKARQDGKLIFLSIGYSSCYWCHVMERESFNDAEIARVLNDSFVCIKVDREELPEVDDIFMSFVQMTNEGRGGWPLTVFLTPDAKPIAGTTYLPPRDARGMPGLLETLGKVLQAWKDHRENLEAQARAVTAALERANIQRGFSFRPLDRQVIADAVTELRGEFDPQYGGFGYDPRFDQRPKFPQASILNLLCYQFGQSGDQRAGAMLGLTLHRMNQGGIWDCVGGGFHRYSVDRYWRVPHFEKMLYDNAQLARVYLEAFELTRDRVFRRMAMRIFEFVENELTSPEGGFYTALDAESEHEEGKYYVWTKQQVQSLLSPPEFDLFAKVQMKGPPNFSDDRYVLQLGNSLRAVAEEHGVNEGNLAGLLEQAAAKLLVARSQRTRPLLDTKILTDLNGLMIGALADGYRVLGNEAYRASAEQAANLLLDKSRDAEGRLYHVYAAGSAKGAAYLDDHAFLIDGLLALYRATQEDRWLAAARTISDQMNELFWDESDGGYFQTAKDQPVVLTRLKPTHDASVPSGNSVAALALVRLAQATGEASYAERAGRTLRAFSASVTQSPGQWPLMARALGEYLDAGYKNELLGTRTQAVDPQVVQAQAIMQQKQITAGRAFQFDVALEIERQWHIYANALSSPQYVPTTLEVTSSFPVADVSVEYPRPRPYQPPGVDEAVAVYSGRERIRVRAKVDANAPIGPGEIQLSFRYQACNDQRCLAPKTIHLALPVEVVAPASSDSNEDADPSTRPQP
jgi:hypothetical protein